MILLPQMVIVLPDGLIKQLIILSVVALPHPLLPARHHVPPHQG
jgi:hypothetical protein